MKPIFFSMLRETPGIFSVKMGAMPIARYRLKSRALCMGAALLTFASATANPEWETQFSGTVHPFLESYCLDCHDSDARKGDLDLSVYKNAEMIGNDFTHWDLVLERLRNGDMPPAKKKHQPSMADRQRVIDWLQKLRKFEAHKSAGDPGPVLARRLNNAEYDYTIRDLTGVDLRPTRAFPIDPANQAGFDNSGESLAMSPALVKKYLGAAREVAEHLALQPEGFTFAPYPMIADTDRDKWAVFRIIDFYRRQPTDYADYFEAAWRFEHRANKSQSIEEFARESKLSGKYLDRVHSTLAGKSEAVGPVAKLQAAWRDFPPTVDADSSREVRAQCEQMRDYVLRIRASIVPVVPNLTAPSIHPGSQTMVMWKNRQMAANRRRYDPKALQSISDAEEEKDEQPKASEATGDNNKSGSGAAKPSDKKPKKRKRHVQAPTPSIVQKGGFALPPALLTRESSATAQMAAAKNHQSDPDLIVPADPEERKRYEDAFARFADLFPDAFYITERARVYLDAKSEQENAGRLLSAGLHSMTGYFRDDQPLYDMILDAEGQKELDRLWDEFDFISSVPQRMHTSLVWFERTDSGYLRDAEFDPYRPEDKSVTSQEKIHKFAELYLAKAIRNGASETAQQAIRDHFSITARNIAHVEKMRIDAEPSHMAALERFAARAYRRPLTDAEKADLHDFYKEVRADNGGDHEEAVRDCVTRILVSPKFLFRMDLVEAAEAKETQTPVSEAKPATSFNPQPLSDYALASRLSYFLWSSMPDEELLALAAKGELHKPGTLRQQVRRMTRDERVRNFATEFGGNWLDFRRFEEINSVDRERFPMFNNELREAMFQEPIHFIVDVIQKNRSVLDFIYATDTFVNEPLARHYGITPVPKGTNDWVHVANARSVGRGGVLPMAAFLTANSPGLRTSPVKRGNWVVKRIFGERIPPPPAIVPELPKDEKALGTLTLREALAQHRERSGCRECHSRFDSFGLIFEGYGPVGEHRKLDLGGRPVDTRAEFPGGSSGEGLEGLLDYIRDHRQDDFLDNLCRKLVAYGLGRTLILGDEPLIEEMRKQLAAHQDRFDSLIETIVTSPQFLNKRGHTSLAKN